MNMNKLTQKSQEAFYDAQNSAIRHGHQEVDGEHLALALINQENGLIPKTSRKDERACGKYFQPLWK